MSALDPFDTSSIVAVCVVVGVCVIATVAAVIWRSLVTFIS